MNDDSKHLQKIILFSEENYAGDALVLMRDKPPAENLPVYKVIDLKKIKYTPRGGAEFVSFSGMANSLIVDTGYWSISADSQDTLLANAGTFFTTLSDKSGFYPINFVNVWRYYEEPSPVVVKKSEPQLLQNLYSSEKKSYEFTFFPLENAFIISPAPAGVRDDDTKSFRWEILDGDEFSVKVYAEGKTIVNPKLIFKTHEANSERPTPIIELVNGKWTPPKSDVVNVQDGNRYKYKQVHEGAKWGFDFVCTIDGKNCPVDPEIQIGAGTGRRP